MTTLEEKIAACEKDIAKCKQDVEYWSREEATASTEEAAEIPRGILWIKELRLQSASRMLEILQLKKRIAVLEKELVDYHWIKYPDRMGS